MYESYYGLNTRPFQLKPDPHFFYGSKPHKRAMAYLEYGLSQGEGFIVITGEVGAGKTTLMRNLLCNIRSDKIYAGQIVNTHLDSDDALRMVLAAFGLPCEDAGKAVMLTRLERFLHQCDREGKQALLVVDEAQNLSTQTLEELRMLSNFQTAEKSLLQTFLLGQPEFKKTLLCADLQQLRQRVIATYHLGPMDALETGAYIKHRLHTAGWSGSPSLSDDAVAAIHEHAKGIPRKINTLCDRLFLMGYLEELRDFNETDVERVIEDIREEYDLPGSDEHVGIQAIDRLGPTPGQQHQLEELEERVNRTEKSVIAIVDALRKVLTSRRA